MIKRIGFTVVAVLALSMAAQAADMQSGTWVLNVAKSTSSNSLARSITQVISMDGGWVITRSTRTNSEGKIFTQASIEKPDGQIRPYVCNGTLGPNCYPDLRNLTKLDDFHYKRVHNSITGKGKGTVTMVISADGKTKTVTQEGLSNDGKAYNSVNVFDKQ